VYDADDAPAILAVEAFKDEALVSEIDGKFVSAFVRAVKPETCCAPGCCSC
jgi:arsenite methyltransferase